MSEPFRYQPLNKVTSIRLIKLLPNLIDDQIAVILSHFDNNGFPSYHALSYHWGDPASTCTVNINGHLHHLHENLWQFLYQMWKVGATDYYWTDFLCLDQGNMAEISVQVGRMGDIYSEAEQVLMWLGHDQIGENALRLIGDWPGEVQISRDAMDSDQDWTVSTNLVEERMNHDGILAALLHVLTRPYWKRVWIIQEAVLGKKAFLLYGAAITGLEEFRSRIDPFRHRRLDFTLGSNIWSICELRETQGKKPLWELLLEFETSISTKKVDKIYGMLGLVAYPDVKAPSPLATSLPVDYQKNIHSVFWDTVFSSSVPWHKTYDFLLGMGRMFHSGGIDMWDFRHLERYTTSPTTAAPHRRAAGIARAAFHSMNALFDISGKYADWEKALHHLIVAFGHENDAVRTYLYSAHMIGIVLAVLGAHIHAVWKLAKKSANISHAHQYPWRCTTHHKRGYLAAAGYGASSDHLYPFGNERLDGLCADAGEGCNGEEMYLDFDDEVVVRVFVGVPGKTSVDIRCRK